MGEYLREAYLQREIEDEQTKKIHELEQELKIRTEDNAELYAKLCNALVQLNEANDTIIGMIGAGSYQADEMGKAYFKKWGVE